FPTRSKRAISPRWCREAALAAGQTRRSCSGGGEIPMSPHFRIRPIRVISVSMPLPRALPVTLLLVAAACGDSAPRSVASERDSAGVRIVENPVPDASVPQWSLSAEPTVVLGDLDGSEQEQFGNMIDVRRLTSGELVVSDASSYQVRVFDSTGQWLRTLGQRGEGPGDFSLVAGLLAGDDDAISAWDIRQRRITRFTPDGNVIGLLQVERPAMVTDGMGHAFTPSASPVARLGDG